MTSSFLPRAAIAATLLCIAAPVFAGPLDRDTPACAIAREAPTDGNIEACTGRPVFSEPAFWLVELDDGSAPAVHFVARYHDAATCFGATFSHELKRGGFAVCVPLDEDAEAELIEYGAYEYGLIEGDF